MKDVFAKTDLLGTLFTDEVYFFYEEPQLFSCKNQSGQQFLVLLTDLDDRQWLLLPISESVLALLKSNSISIRHAILNPEDGFVWYLRNGDFAKLLHVEQLFPRDITDDLLPDEDVYLDYNADPFMPVSEGKVLEFSIKERRAILDFSFNKNSHIREIRCGTLGEALSTVQHLLYSLSYDGEAGRIPIDIRMKNEMNVAGFLAASFGVRIKSKNIATLFGETSVCPALKEFAQLISIKDNEEELKTFLQKHSKKATIHYSNLMKLLNQENMEMGVDIATPAKFYTSVAFSKKEISGTLDILNKEIMGMVDTFTVHGTIIGVHTTKHTFAFIGMDDEEIIGKLAESFYSAEFVVPKIVEAVIEKRIEVNAVSGKEKYTYTLIELKDES